MLEIHKKKGWTAKWNILCIWSWWEIIRVRCKFIGRLKSARRARNLFTYTQIPKQPLGFGIYSYMYRENLSDYDALAVLPLSKRINSSYQFKCSQAHLTAFNVQYFFSLCFLNIYIYIRFHAHCTRESTCHIIRNNLYFIYVICFAFSFSLLFFRCDLLLHIFIEFTPNLTGWVTATAKMKKNYYICIFVFRLLLFVFEFFVCYYCRWCFAFSYAWCSS